jgi:type VI protein secretion system component VasF
MDCNYKTACGVIAVVIALVLLLIWTGKIQVSMKEKMSDIQITNAVIHKLLTEDPQNSAAVMRSLPPAERAKYERMTQLPYDPRYYAKQ